MDSCEVPESRGDQAGLKGKEEALGWASWDISASLMSSLAHRTLRGGGDTRS